MAKIWLFMLLMPGLWAQKAEIIDWKKLSAVEFKDHYFPELEGWYLRPHFAKAVQKLDSQQVIIKGYVIPLDVGSGSYALSANPFSSCFFCGGSGPESVMNLHFEKPPRRYKTDEVVQFTGTLILNDDDVDQFTYILREVRELKTYR